MYLLVQEAKNGSKSKKGKILFTFIYSLNSGYKGTTDSEFKETFSEQLYCYKGVSYPVGPLTKEAVCRYKDDNNYIRGIVKVELSDLIENDLDGFLDLISEKLTESPLLMDIGYEPVSVFEEELYLLVSGDVSEILDEEKDNEDGNE